MPDEHHATGLHLDDPAGTTGDGVDDDRPDRGAGEGQLDGFGAAAGVGEGGCAGDEVEAVGAGGDVEGGGAGVGVVRGFATGLRRAKRALAQAMRPTIGFFTSSAPWSDR
ncbi:hypothetical protein SMD11_2790 [Streptomyces albireticuli]|uniref:Uncharacterized protein n=1 Tax=Streptomyces albireticuli TaxID=1940 RepID=A0A1Z2L2D8_9ACTN|nr:hypothetical protein SMD11_2790 [Streptomyces albireticuli]